MWITDPNIQNVLISRWPTGTWNSKYFKLSLPFSLTSSSWASTNYISIHTVEQFRNLDAILDFARQLSSPTSTQSLMLFRLFHLFGTFQIYSFLYPNPSVTLLASMWSLTIVSQHICARKSLRPWPQHQFHCWWCLPWEQWASGSSGTRICQPCPSILT